MPRHEFRARQDDYLEFATQVPLNPGSTLHILNFLERARRDKDFDVADGSVPDGSWDPIFEKLFRLRDTSDFDLLYLNNLIEAYGGHPAVDPQLWADAEQAVLDFKYWYTDPTPDRMFDGAPVVDSMWYWTENHVLLFKVNEYLAGQRHPDDTFTVTGWNGIQHKERAAREIRKWLEERARWGFTEWHSDVYYQKDMTPLLSLVEWAEDEDIRRRAAMVLDLLFLDVALHLQNGNFGATHGRSYIKDKPTALKQDNFHSSKLFFEDTDLPYQSRGAADASLFARARKYRLPEVIRRIAKHEEPMIDRQRMNLPLDEVPDPDPNVLPPPAPHGLDFDDEENLPFWWSMNAMTSWNLTRITLEVGERENLWDAQFAEFKLLRDLVWVDGDLDQSVRNARPLLLQLWHTINFALLKEVNTYTYRTKDYMLSTAQDYRKGLRGSQTHISQATLGEHAVVFVQHPTYRPVPAGGSPPPDWNWQQEDEPGPGYWSGNGAEPRAAQFENVVIQIFAPQYAPFTALGFDYNSETHAYFPEAHFDEVVKGRHWTFGRKNDGYVALWCRTPVGWRLDQPEVYENAGLHFDLVAPFFLQNAWIMELGSASESGTFEEFMDAMNAASIVATPVPDQDGDGFDDGFDVQYESPSQGSVTFGWHAPLVVNGVEVPLADYPRFDNPFVRTEFDDTRYEVSDGEYGLVLDFETNERRVKGPRGGEKHDRCWGKRGRGRCDPPGRDGEGPPGRDGKKWGDRDGKKWGDRDGKKRGERDRDRDGKWRRGRR
jgi:hypothetical protein